MYEKAQSQNVYLVYLGTVRNSVDLEYKIYMSRSLLPILTNFSTSVILLVFGFSFLCFSVQQ